MKILIEEFKDAAFLYLNKKFVVSSANIVNGKAVIKTDSRTFVFLPAEFEAFYDAVVFVGIVDIKKEFKPTKLEPRVEITSKATSLNAEIIQANVLSTRLTGYLEEVFSEIATGNASDKTFKKAEAMVKTSNAIVAVQIANYKYLTLGK